jgi:hypothetical protein
MFNKQDLNALIFTVLIILLGYATMYFFVYFGEYLNII